MKNILFVVDEKKMGGVSILLEDMLNMMNLSNKHVDILVLHNNGDRLINLSSNVNIIYGSKFFDTIDLPIKEVLHTKKIGLILRKVRLVFEMKTGFIKYRIKHERKKVLKINYDTEIAFKDGFTAIFVGYGNCKNKIHWLHYDYRLANPNAKYNKMFNKILPTFNRIIAVSKGVMDDFNKVYHLEQITSVINNLVNVDRILKLSEEKNYELKRKPLQIISVGRLHYMKGYNRFIEAIQKLKKDNLTQNVEFKIYGDGPEMTNLSNQIFSNNLEHEVTLMGKTDNPYKLIKDADMFVLSSYYESFGLVIVESLTLKVPVLATNNSATGELIDNNINGLIVENSVDGIYNGLKNVITNHNLLIEFKTNLKNYNYRVQNKKILNELEQLFR